MLRVSLSIFLLLCSSVAGANELIHQDLQVKLDPAGQRVDVLATISGINGTSELPRQYRLNRGASIESVRFADEHVSVRHEKGIISLPAEKTYTTLQLRYHIRFTDRPPEETVGIENPSFGVQATITENGTFLSGDSNWHPVPVGGGHESLFSLSVTGPAGLIGVTGGQWLGTRNDALHSTTNWQTIVPRKNLALAAGRYLVGRDQVGKVALLTFFRHGNEKLSPGYLAACKKYIKTYQKLLGPFPYPSYSVVENFYPTGYGLPGWTLLGSSVIRLPFILYTSLPHEITHAWWGNAIAVDSDKGNWAEGLATYMADYYLKEINSGREALEYRRKILRDYATLAGGDGFPLKAFRSRRSKKDQAIGYGKAAMVFHMLRQQVGDRQFWQTLKVVAQSGRGKSYAWSDLRKEFERISRVDLKPFFDQWLNRPGAPVLSLADIKHTKTRTGWQITGVIKQSKPAYSLKIPVRVSTGNGSVDFVLESRDEKTGFDLMVAAQPQRISFDPDSHIFRLLDAQEIPRSINHLRASRQPLVVIARGAAEMAAQSQDLLKGLQWHNAPFVAEPDFDQDLYSRHDILFIGLPETIPLPTTSFTLENGDYRLDGQTYKSKEHTLFLVMPNRAGKSTWGCYLPNSVEAARDNARRIPHYGRYSYLAFRDGRNLAKATWEPEDSPLTFKFAKE